MPKFIDKAVEILLASSGLQPDEAKLAVYYAIATWKLPAFEVFPILSLCGPPGTGKTMAMETLRPWCCKPRLISAKRITPAALRDELRQAKDATAIIEEADENASPAECEQLLAARCSPTTGKLSVKEVKYRQKWQLATLNVYGATIIHYRRAFIDQAIDSRTITIKTRFRNGNYKRPATETELTATFKTLGRLISPGKVSELGSGRLWDIWRPVLAVARLLSDDAWLAWAKDRIEGGTEELKDGHSFEVAGLIFGRIVESLSDKGVIQYRELRVMDDIVVPLRRQAQVYITPWQANKQLKELGFHTYRSGGTNKFLPTNHSLHEAAAKIGYEDELL